MVREQEQYDSPGKLSRSIEFGISYLAEHQLPNGEFCCYYAPDDKMVEWCVPDSTVFPTSLISACLLSVRNHPKVSKILSSAGGFLQYQTMAGGVWNYFTKWNPLFKYSPADADDTVFASYVLQSLGYDIPSNKNHLLANRNSNGLFYTWFILRPTKIKYLNLEYIKIIFREIKRPLHTPLFWWKHEATRTDVDAVVNANVLFYLGLSSETRPVIDFLMNIIVAEIEENSDRWYKNPFNLYYFISRNYKKMKELEPVREIIVQRILRSYNVNGSFRSSALETALAISTLLNFDHIDDRIANSIKFLLDSQQPSGCWDRHIFFYSGPSKAVGWGSEEICTAYCIEALEAYRKLEAPGFENS
jgi:hypothetical protein